MSEARTGNRKRTSTPAKAEMNADDSGAHTRPASTRKGSEEPDERELATPAILIAFTKPYVVAPLVLMVGATVGLVLSVGPAVLTVTGIVILFSIFAVWQSVRMLTGELPVPEDMALVKLGRRGTLMEQKRSVLRALKDLENERDIGKIEADDFEAVALRYRNEAKGILRAMDAEVLPYRERAEALATAHLRTKGLTALDSAKTSPEVSDASQSGSTHPTKSDHPTSETAFSDASSETKKQGKGAIAAAIEAVRGESSAPKATATATATGLPLCEKCTTANDSDAKFCKNCAAPLSSLHGLSKAALSPSLEDPKAPQ
jgi:hypothetical protein